MSSNNRNQFLEAGDSDDDAGHDYDSEDDFQKGGRGAKRRRVDDDDSDAEEFSDEEGEKTESGGAKLREDTAESGEGGEEQEEAEGRTKDKKSGLPTELPGVSKPLTKKNLVATEAAIKKSGVVYLSRIPPFMKPAKLRSLLEPYGKINRIFLTPEDPAEHARRVRNGGNKKRCFTEGWVEFVKKKDAKKACDLLNAQTIGGKKSSWYHDDVWALKYLKGFKWYVHFPIPILLRVLISMIGIILLSKYLLKMPNGLAECALRLPRPPARTRSLSATLRRQRFSTEFSPKRQQNERRSKMKGKNQAAKGWPVSRTVRWHWNEDGHLSRYPWQRKGSRRNNQNRFRECSARFFDVLWSTRQVNGCLYSSWILSLSLCVYP